MDQMRKKVCDRVYSNIAIHGETGKYPLCIKIFTHIIKYWVRLRGGEVSELLRAAADLDRGDREAGRQSWSRTVEYLLRYTNTTPRGGPGCYKNLAKTFKHKIQTQYNTWWLNEVKSTSKLDFYGKHKKHFRFESYLDNIPRGPRVYITRLRISGHCLPVEIQRYHKKPKKREERLCTICNSEGTADEYHYLLKCANSELCALREKFFANIKREFPQFINFTDENIINYCLNMSDVSTQLVMAEYARGVLCMYREEVGGPVKSAPETIVTRVGRVSRKPQKLNL